MRPIKVNADYELVLYGMQNPPEIVNESIEFLALFLEPRPLFSTRIYSQDYLNFVKEVSGHEPVIISSAMDLENWWGDLFDIPLERKLNSKEFTAFLSESKIINAKDELDLEEDTEYLAKSPYGMSGQDMVLFNQNKVNKLDPLLRKAKRLIIEPLLDRKKDFSHYIFSDGKMICYENMVNPFFQYKGTLFSDLKFPVYQRLRFFNEIDSMEWKKFETDLESLKQVIKKEGGARGYSVDSFVYNDKGTYKIKSFCEVNYRKTMGLVAYLLSNKYCGPNNFSFLILGKSLKKVNIFSYIQTGIRPIAWNPSTMKGCLHLSPGDTRFEIFLISADSFNEGMEFFGKLKKLLPDCEFSIKF